MKNDSELLDEELEKRLVAMKDKKILVDDDFLKLVTEQSNIRLERVWDKIKRLERLI